MKLASCLLVGSLLLEIGFPVFANPPAQETVVNSLTECEEVFQPESVSLPATDQVPELKIFPPPEEVRLPLSVPEYSFLIDSKDVPEILHHLDQVINFLFQEPDHIEMSRLARHLLTRLHVWLRGPYQQIDIHSYVLQLAEPSIAQFNRVERVSAKQVRFAEVEPLLPKIMSMIDDREFDLGLRTRALMLKREFLSMQIESQMAVHAITLVSMTPETKWKELELLELAMERDDVQPLQRKADILKLAALYTDKDILKQFMGVTEMNRWGIRLALMDMRVAEAVVVYGMDELTQLPRFLSTSIDSKFDRMWRWQHARQVTYFSIQLRKFSEQYDAPMPMTEKSLLIDQFLAGYDSEQLNRGDAHKHIAVVIDLVEKTAVHWKSRDQLEKSEAGRALWTALRLISVL